MLSHRKPLPPQGLFIVSPYSTPASICLQYLAPSPTSTADIEPHSQPQTSSNKSTHSKARHPYSLSLLIHIFPQRIYQILRSLSPSRMPLPPHQREGDELRRHLFCGAPEEGVGEVLGERGLVGLTSPGFIDAQWLRRYRGHTAQRHLKGHHRVTNQSRSARFTS